MRLTFRPATRRDFHISYIGTYYRGAGADRADLLEREWEWLRSNPSTISMVVEDQEREPGNRGVGYAQAVFVTDTLVDRAGSTPWVNLLLAPGRSEETHPILTPEGVREANSGLGLNVLITHWVWNEAALTADASRRVRDYLTRQFLTLYAGYNLRQILLEVFGEEALQMAINAGFRLRTAYSAYFREHPRPAPELQPYLTGITRKEATDSEGSLVSQAFIYTPPSFSFKPHEQELLCLALIGYSDDELTDPLCVSLAAVRKRWTGIYERVASVDPDLLPSAGDGTRGAEKRRDLLAYLRDHPEELRPVERPGRDSS